MNEFMESLRLSFDCSINYLTWAFFSLVTAFAFDRLSDMKRFKNRVGNCISRLICKAYFIVFFLIGVANINYIREIFSFYLGSSIISNTFWLLIMVVLVVNAGLVVIGIGDKKSKDL
ncbi:hypothetical protein [Xenorhabdus bovienii]|uniref:Putative phage protein n=1 Tax=Xenorhabdus bovienii TaxID=40576 RepID=A0A0B6X6Q5_XENBV|nr:hypothetical protein [Xenorhabdus bovienii]CDM88378.1 Putative phage protein [Xenorhabdus bovienii]